MYAGWLVVGEHRQCEDKRAVHVCWVVGREGRCPRVPTLPAHRASPPSHLSAAGPSHPHPCNSQHQLVCTTHQGF